MNTTNQPAPNVPVPAGAVTDGWTSYDHDGTLARSLEWSSHDTANVGLSIDGWQRATGEYTRGISVYAVDGKQIDAVEARQLAAALLNAADELDQLGNRHAVDSATRGCCGGIGGHTQSCR